MQFAACFLAPLAPAIFLRRLLLVFQLRWLLQSSFFFLHSCWLELLHQFFSFTLSPQVFLFELFWFFVSSCPRAACIGIGLSILMVPPPCETTVLLLCHRPATQPATQHKMAPAHTWRNAHCAVATQKNKSQVQGSSGRCTEDYH